MLDKSSNDFYWFAENLERALFHLKYFDRWHTAIQKYPDLAPGGGTEPGTRRRTLKEVVAEYEVAMDRIISYLDQNKDNATYLVSNKPSFESLIDSATAKKHPLKMEEGTLLAIEAGKVNEEIQPAIQTLKDIKSDVEEIGSTIRTSMVSLQNTLTEKMNEAEQFIEGKKSSIAEMFKETTEAHAKQWLNVFSVHFMGEANHAAENAMNALRWACSGVVVLIASVIYISINLPSDYLQSMTIYGFVALLGIRIIPISFLVWIVAYFLKERGNFNHIATANRHRQNLCNTYVAISHKLDEKERERFMAEIMPEIARLGKTGFITKETVISSVGDAARVVLEARSATSTK